MFADTEIISNIILRHAPDHEQSFVTFDATPSSVKMYVSPAYSDSHQTYELMIESVNKGDSFVYFKDTFFIDVIDVMSSTETVFQEELETAELSSGKDISFSLPPFIEGVSEDNVEFVVNLGTAKTFASFDESKREFNV